MFLLFVYVMYIQSGFQTNDKKALHRMKVGNLTFYNDAHNFSSSLT